MLTRWKDRCGTPRRRTAMVMAGVLAVATAAAGCSGATVGAQNRATDGLVWAKPADANVLDPTIANNATSWEILRMTYENLVGLGDRLKLEPQLAESWSQPSATTYVFRLREGVKFSNGRPLTADDVVGSFRRLMDPQLAATWASMLDLSAVSGSGNEVTVTLKAPRTSFLAALAGSSASILPMKELNDGSFDPKKQLLGTGPYRATGHSQDELWTFERNPHYWRPGLPKVDRVMVRVMPDDSSRIAALRDGSADVTTFENPDAIRLLQGQAGVKTVVQATTDFYRLDINAGKSIFTDDRLRQAVALSVDRRRLLDVALGGVGRPTAAVAAAFEGICQPDDLPFARPDVAKARQLVEAAGATGKTVEILTPSLIPMSSPMAQVLQENLQAAGLKVRLASIELGAIVKRAYNGKAADFDLVVSTFAGYADPAMTAVRWNPDMTGYNKPWMRKDEQFNKVLDQALSTPVGPARTTILRDVCRRIAQNANIIPLVTKDNIVAYRSDQIDAPIRSLEGYMSPLRNIGEFTVK